MKKWLFFLVFLFIFPSCVSYNEDLKLNKNFSGVLQIEFYLPGLFFDRKDYAAFQKKLNTIEEEAKKYKGIQVLESKVFPIGNQMEYILKIKFSSFENLKKFLNSNDKNSLHTQNSNLFNINFKNIDGKIKFERVISPFGKGQENYVEGMIELFSSNIWTFKVRFPYEVEKSNGKVQEDKKTVIWKYSFYTLYKEGAKMEATLKKPSFLDKITDFLKNIF